MPSGLTPKLPLIRGSNSSFEQAAKYLPYIKVQDIAFDSNAIDSNIDPNLLNVRIVYSILPLETDDVIELTLPTD